VPNKILQFVIVGLLCLGAGIVVGQIAQDRSTNVLLKKRETLNSIPREYSGDVTTSHLLWMKTKGLPYIASPILYRGRLVMVKDGGIVTAYDTKTGTEVYQERVVAAGKF
jgi:hypothetical protein